MSFCAPDQSAWYNSKGPWGRVNCQLPHPGMGLQSWHQDVLYLSMSMRMGAGIPFQSGAGPFRLCYIWNVRLEFAERTSSLG